MIEPRKHPYLLASVAAIILAVVVWLLVPKEYAAQIKIADEYKETDLAVGLNNISAKMREMMGTANQGINDIEVYCKVLKTNDFAKEIAHIKLPYHKKTYGQYLAKVDTVEAVKRNVEYNVSTKKQTLTVQFVDKDPLVAALMLDSVVSHLQNFVTNKRRDVFIAQLANADRERKTAAERYRIAQHKYALYADSHNEEISEEGRLHKTMLERNVTESFKSYVSASEQYFRYQALIKRVYASFAVIKANEVPLRTINHLSGYVITFVFIALVSVKCFFLVRTFRKEKRTLDYGNVFSPWFLSIAVWLVLGAAIVLFGSKMDAVPNIFYKCISIWLAVFLISSFLTYNLLPAKTGINEREININHFLFNFFFILSVVLTPLYAYQIYKLVTMFDAQDLVANIRLLAIEGEDRGILNYTMVINQSLLLVALWGYPKIPLWKVVCTIICCFIFAVANMEKLTFFLIFIAIVYVLFERKLIKFRTIAIFSFVLFFIFYVFTISRTSDSETMSDSMSIIDFLGIYFTSPPIAFGHLRPTISQYLCPESLWTVYSYIGKFINGVTVEHDAFSEFVFVPVPTNVYTIMKPFYQDGGGLCVAFFALLYGIGSGLVYRYSINGQSFSKCLYTYLVFVLALQFFDEIIFASIPLFIQRMALIALMCCTCIRFTSKKGMLTHRSVDL